MGAGREGDFFKKNETCKYHTLFQFAQVMRGDGVVAPECTMSWCTKVPSLGQ